MTYRFFTPDPPRTATGRTAAVYRQLREDFLGPAPTFQALSPAPDVLAATWALIREALLARDVSRVDREVVAAATSRANRCRFCVDAHVTLLHALGEPELAEAVAHGDRPARSGHAELVRWAADSRTPRATGWTGRHGPQVTGTLLAFHFVNRVVSALLAPDLLPGGVQRFPAVRSVAGRLYARTARQPAEPGRGLALLGAGIEPPAWAGDSAAGVAYAALRSAAAGGSGLLTGAARETVATTVREQDGRHPSRPAAWAGDLVRGLPGADRVGARIALLAAFAPGAIGPGDVALWRLSHPSDEDLVRLVAYGAITATEHVAAALSPAHS